MLCISRYFQITISEINHTSFEIMGLFFVNKQPKWVAVFLTVMEVVMCDLPQ